MIKLDNINWDGLDWTEVESTVIKSCAYDKNTSSLIIKFKDADELGNMSQYLYAGVPPSVYEKFMDATSKGSHLSQNLKAYPYIKLQ
jgi:hypothetical protein